VSLSVPESAVLENVLPELEADGFEVYARPAAHLLPPFMQNYVPDAIALREGRKLAIEVLRDEPSARGRLGHIQELFSKQKDWELRVYWLSPSYGSQTIEAAPLESIDGAIESVQALAEEGRTAPALLMAWSTFEALGRLLLPGKFAKPQTPARLVEILAAEGQVTPTEADRLRHLIQVRNQLVHGGLQATASTAELGDFVRILRSLRGVAPSSIEGGRPQLS
jgi:REase_AHJR-like